jgi:hypothetical protein
MFFLINSFFTEIPSHLRFKNQPVDTLLNKELNREIKCQLDATDYFYFRSNCLLKMFRALPNNTDSNHLYNTLELLMMGIVVPETCWASNKICNKTHLLHLVGILFPHIIDDARSKSHQICMFFLCCAVGYWAWQGTFDFAVLYCAVRCSKKWVDSCLSRLHDSEHRVIVLYSGVCFIHVVNN